jgi:hypothetical protein
MNKYKWIKLILKTISLKLNLKIKSSNTLSINKINFYKKECRKVENKRVWKDISRNYEEYQH